MTLFNFTSCCRSCVRQDGGRDHGHPVSSWDRVWRHPLPHHPWRVRSHRLVSLSSSYSPLSLDFSHFVCISVTFFLQLWPAVTMQTVYNVIKYNNHKSGLYILKPKQSKRYCQAALLLLLLHVLPLSSLTVNLLRPRLVTSGQRCPLPSLLSLLSSSSSFSFSSSSPVNLSGALVVTRCQAVLLT